MKDTILIILSFITVAFTAGCITENDNKSDSITVSELPCSIVNNFDFEHMQNEIEKEIHMTFPDAKYSRFSFFGNCEDINAGEGKVDFFYLDEKVVLFQLEPKVTLIIGSVNTKDKTCKITIFDMTNAHPSMVFSPKIDNSLYKQLLKTSFEKTRLYPNCQMGLIQTDERYHLSIYDKIQGMESFDLEINYESIPTPSNQPRPNWDLKPMSPVFMTH